MISMAAIMLFEHIFFDFRDIVPFRLAKEVSTVPEARSLEFCFLCLARAFPKVQPWTFKI